MKRSQRRVRSLAVAARTLSQRDVVACTRKTKISTKQAAKDSAARATTRFGAKMHIYECPACGHWHITHVDQAVERERRRAG